MIEADALLFSDPHFPFHHPDSLTFLTAVRWKYNPKASYCAGDLTDSYCFSRYPKDPEQVSVTQEFAMVQEGVAKLGEVFPSLEIADSNHDARLWNRATMNGIPRRMVRPYLDVIGAWGLDWKLKDDILFQDSLGKNWYINHQPHGTTISYTRAHGCNTAVGHCHQYHAVQRVLTPAASLWAVDIGCLIGMDRIAFGYSKNSIRFPARGCVVIIEGTPRVIPMVVDSHTGRWDGRVS